jgi:hypothetical protein
MFQKAKDVDSGGMGHGIPFGYTGATQVTDERYPSGKRKTKTVLEPIPEKKAHVKKGFELADQVKSITEISKILKLNWSKVQYFLHNPFYAGFERYCYYFRKIPDLDPVISIETFNRVQKLIRERCHSHRLYKPMLIKEKDHFKLDYEIIKAIPIINRAKHNLTC